MLQSSAFLALQRISHCVFDFTARFFWYDGNLRKQQTIERQIKTFRGTFYK